MGIINAVSSYSFKHVMHCCIITVIHSICLTYLGCRLVRIKSQSSESTEVNIVYTYQINFILHLSHMIVHSLCFPGCRPSRTSPVNAYESYCNAVDLDTSDEDAFQMAMKRSLEDFQ